MAASRVADELTDLRKSFEKTLEGGSDEEERMLDILSAMMKVVGNLDLLKQTGVVQMLKGANKKVGEGKVSNKIKDLLAKWKADCSAPPTAEVKASEAPTAPATETKVEAKPAASSSSSSLGGISRSSSSGDLEFDDGGYFKSLPINRQKVRFLHFVETFII